MPLIPTTISHQRMAMVTGVITSSMGSGPLQMDGLAWHRRGRPRHRGGDRRNLPPPVQLRSAMRAVPLHLEAGSDVRRSLEELALQHQAGGFVLSVVGNLSQAAFACPGRSAPTVLQGELEIITLQGTLSPDGVHLHLSFSDAECQVWGGHLEQGTLVLRGADLLVGFLTEPEAPTRQALTHAQVLAEPRVEIATLPGCPFSRRALRLLRTLGIPFRDIQPDAEGSVPQLFIDGVAIGGYDALAELHSRGALEALRHP